MTLNQKKVKRFEKALDSFERYRDWQKRMLEEGKITIEEYEERIKKRAEMLDL